MSIAAESAEDEGSRCSRGCDDDPASLPDLVTSTRCSRHSIGGQRERCRNSAGLPNRNQWVAWKRVQRPGQPKPEGAAARPRPRAHGVLHERADLGDVRAGSRRARRPRRCRDRVRADIGGRHRRHRPRRLPPRGRCNGAELDSTTLGAWIAALNSYTEISPSGRGLRIIGRATFPEAGKGERKRGPFEAYSYDRFLTITGNVFEGFDQLRDMPQDVLDAFHAAAFPKPEPRPLPMGEPTPVTNLDDGRGRRSSVRSEERPRGTAALERRHLRPR